MLTKKQIRGRGQLWSGLVFLLLVLDYIPIAIEDEHLENFMSV